MKDKDYNHVIMDIITKSDLSIYKDFDKLVSDVEKKFGKLEEKRRSFV